MTDHSTRKKACFILIAVLTIALWCFFLVKRKEESQYNSFKFSDGDFSIQFTLDGLRNGDAKFMGDKIITGIDGHFSIIDNAANPSVTAFPDLNVNWLDPLESENIIIYGNFDNKIGLIRLDDTYDVISNDIIFDSDNLLIDPTINKFDGTYYLTVTEIEGTVNNADPLAENGDYRIHLYRSDDLKSWELLSDIDHQKSNLEDVEFTKIGEHLCAVYEKEIVDKGCSSILMRTSADGGRSWSDPVELLPADCDHEPVGLFRTDHNYVLCYSCDLEDPGTSYMGGRAYYAVYDDQWVCTEKDVLLKTRTPSGILWYDLKRIGDKEYFLFAKDYLTTCDMVVEYR